MDDADCHAVLDHLVKAGLADPKRLGCYGNSYGGFMVNWLVGTTDRFAAAVSSNGVTNQVSAYRELRRRLLYNPQEGLGEPLTPEGVESLWRQSPLRHVSNVHTPLMILQGESDLRCPPADNEQFFIALRRARAGRSSTCCTPTATTRWPRAHDPTAASTAWSGSWRGSEAPVGAREGSGFAYTCA